jgi:transposase
MSTVRFVGLDVHAETIAIAVAEPGGEVRSVGVIPNREDSIRRAIKKLGPLEHLRVCYEAGPTGYALYWQLTALGVRSDVVAPTLVPMKAGDRVMTDRRDAERLARWYRAGDRVEGPPGAIRSRVTKPPKLPSGGPVMTQVPTLYDGFRATRRYYVYDTCRSTS